MWTLSADWEALLWEATRAELSAAALEPRALAAAVIARSHRYTDDRQSLRAPVAVRDRERDLAARALFFTVADAAKVHVPIAELALRGLLPPRPPRILDVGAGPGAMTIGLLSCLPAPPAHVTAVDQDERALSILRRVVSSLPGPRPTLETLVADAARVPDGRFDLICAGSVLNELAPARRLPLIEKLLARLAGDGALILIEPALRTTARDLHALRDAVLAAGGAHVFAPCTRQARCPALDDERDWCHEDRPAGAPPRLASLMARTGLRGNNLKFAYLTLRLSPEPLVVDLAGRRVLRVVSGPLDQKGTIERMVCGAEGRVRFRILRRDRGDHNRGLAQARRGDVLLVDEHGALERREPAGHPG